MHTTSEAGDKLTVLIADDIDASREHLVRLVSELGHHCLQARSGREALECIEAQAPDMVLLDLLMPDLDGFEVTRRASALHSAKWLPIIVASSLEGDEHFIHALAMGAADYLVKPVRPAILRAKLMHYARVLALQSNTAVMAHKQQAINEHIADAIVTVDGDGIICELNQAARELLQRKGAGNLIGQSMETLLGLQMQDLAIQREIGFEDAEGRKIPLAVSSSTWSFGTRNYCTIALHDLSEWRRVERMKDEFLATVSHELRTPLTSVLGAMGLLISGAAGELPAAAMEFAKVAQRNGERLSRLIDDVLDLTKLEGNRMVLNVRTHCLSALLQEAVAANTGYAQRSGVRLALHTEIPTANAPVDADRFFQIMANLLSNAIKHSPKDAVVDVLLSRRGHNWLVQVRDHGQGIDPDFRRHMFEKFSQADGSDQRKIGGTGLGLYITRMLIERMGGSIAVESEMGVGSTFSVLLPTDPNATMDQWVLYVARDTNLLARLVGWTPIDMHCEKAFDAAAAQHLLLQYGPPAAVIADPRAQGSAREFCQRLLDMAKPNTVMLVSDSVDASFAQQHGVAWHPMASLTREQFSQHLLALVERNKPGVRHG